MADISSQKPVHVTGEERPHPALRKLGRACISLARWQQERHQQEPADDANQDGNPVAIPPPLTRNDIPEVNGHGGYHG